MDIIDLHERTKSKFFSWMIGRYGVTEDIFNQAPWIEQCKSISRLLGYPYEFPSKWTNVQVEEKVRDYLYLYEDIIHSYPFGMEDPLDKINSMDYIERLTIMPELLEPAKLNKGLRDAMVPFTKDYSMKLEYFLSLKDALVSLLTPVPAEIDLNKFWQEAIAESHQNTKVPF